MKKGEHHMTDKPITHEAGAPIELSRIHVNYAWNSRSVRRVQDEADLETGGFAAFKAGLKSGQLSPVLVRETKGKTLSGQKTDMQYELIVGFRRYRAVADLNSEMKKGETAVNGLPNGTILAIVRDVANAAEARLLNGQENTARANLKAPDLVFLVKELSKSGMTQEQIGNGLGISQSWTSRLLKVATLPPAVLAHWREGLPIPATVVPGKGTVALRADQAKKELTEPEMRAMADLKVTQEEMIARYIGLVCPVERTPDGGPSEKDKDIERVANVAALMGCLVRAGVLDNGSLDWARVIGPKRKGYPIDCGKDDGQDRLLALWDAAADAFEKEVSKGAASTKEPQETAAQN